MDLAPGRLCCIVIIRALIIALMGQHLLSAVPGTAFTSQRGLVGCSAAARCCCVCSSSAPPPDESPGMPSRSAHVCCCWCLPRLQGHQACCHPHFCPHCSDACRSQIALPGNTGSLMTAAHDSSYATQPKEQGAAHCGLLDACTVAESASLGQDRKQHA